MLFGVTNSILRGTTGLVLDMALFLMDFNLLKLHGLSPFYQSLFKTWHLFKWERLEPANSLHWLLEEPLIHGARLDVQSSSTPGLTSMLCTTGAVTLRKVVDATDPGHPGGGFPHRTEVHATGRDYFKPLD